MVHPTCRLYFLDIPAHSLKGQVFVYTKRAQVTRGIFHGVPLDSLHN